MRPDRGQPTLETGKSRQDLHPPDVAETTCSTLRHGSRHGCCVYEWSAAIVSQPQLVQAPTLLRLAASWSDTRYLRVHEFLEAYLYAAGVGLTELDTMWQALILVHPMSAGFASRISFILIIPQSVLEGHVHRPTCTEQTKLYYQRARTSVPQGMPSCRNNPLQRRQPSPSWRGSCACRAVARRRGCPT